MQQRRDVRAVLLVECSGLEAFPVAPKLKSPRGDLHSLESTVEGAVERALRPWPREHQLASNVEIRSGCPSLCSNFLSCFKVLASWFLQIGLN